MTPALLAALIGIGATLCIDLWALVLRRGFGVPSLNYCLLGRWLLHMPEGRIKHESIGVSGKKRGECVAGWLAHYSIGASFGLLFAVIVGPSWPARPTALPAVTFGIVTVLVPFFTMQPAFGLGIAASRTPHPWRARIKSIGTHTVFGLGLFLTALFLRSLG